MDYGGFTLDPFQEQAIRAIDRGESVLVAAPTGAVTKTFPALARSRMSFWKG